MNRPFERFTLHPESSNPIATDRITIAPLSLQEHAANKEELSKEHAAYEEKATLKPSKLEYFQNARTEFCSVLNDQERSIRLMTACDSLLLAYDQMYAAIEKYAQEQKSLLFGNEISLEDAGLFFHWAESKGYKYLPDCRYCWISENIWYTTAHIYHLYKRSQK